MTYESGPGPQAPDDPTTDPTLPAHSREDQLWAMLAHVSFFFLPLIGPLLVLILRGSQSPFVDAHAREALNLHVTLTIEGILAVVAFFMTLGIGILVIVPLAAIIGLVYALFTIMATLKANEGQRYRYPAILRLF